jgi:hypothetical protein
MTMITNSSSVPALMLDLPLRNSWADLANIKVEEIDQEVVNRVLLNASGVHVLAAPRRPEEGGSSRVDLQACKLGTGRRFTTS